MHKYVIIIIIKELKNMLNVLITGAASGIGKACAEYFINNNHCICIR